MDSDTQDLNSFSCITDIEKIVHIALPLSYSSNQTAGVLSVLESWKCQYVTMLDGIVVGYKDVLFVDTMGRILADHPFIHYDVKAVFSVFKPTVGSILKATVNRISNEHIGCVVHDNINVSIITAYGEVNEVYNPVAIEDEIIFEVSRVDVQRRVILIEGTITPQCVSIMEKLFPGRKSQHKFFSESDSECSTVFNGENSTVINAKSSSGFNDECSSASDDESSASDDESSVLDDESSVSNCEPSVSNCESPVLKNEIQDSDDSNLNGQDDDRITNLLIEETKCIVSEQDIQTKKSKHKSKKIKDKIHKMKKQSKEKRHKKKKDKKNQVEKKKKNKKKDKRKERGKSKDKNKSKK